MSLASWVTGLPPIGTAGVVVVRGKPGVEEKSDVSAMSMRDDTRRA